jgi:hypothetical protein
MRGRGAGWCSTARGRGIARGTVGQIMQGDNELRQILYVFLNMYAVCRRPSLSAASGSSLSVLPIERRQLAQCYVMR